MVLKEFFLVQRLIVLGRSFFYSFGVKLTNSIGIFYYGWICHGIAWHCFYIAPESVSNKPGKFRICQDAASKVKGVHLNGQLCGGPDLLNSLVGVLMRFRRHKVAVSADIKNFFHMIHVADEDVAAFRFLFFKDESLRSWRFKSLKSSVCLSASWSNFYMRWHTQCWSKDPILNRCGRWSCLWHLCHPNYPSVTIPSMLQLIEINVSPVVHPFDSPVATLEPLIYQGEDRQVQYKVHWIAMDYYRLLWTNNQLSTSQ